MLRERGQHDGAENLRISVLAETVAAIRTIGSEDESTVAARLEKIFETESERVANAAALAELLLPMLKRDPEVAAPARGEAIAASAPLEPHAPDHAEPIAARAATDVRAATPAPADIADFIDEMLAQERTRAATAPRRRVS